MSFVPEFINRRLHRSGRAGPNVVDSKLQIETTVAVEGAAVRVQGEVDLRSAPLLRERLLDWVKRSTGTVRVDLSQVPYMDSSGVGTMVFVKRETERAGRRIVLIGLQPRVRSVFEITHLDKFFTIVHSTDEAAPK
jgi:anti-sigma B factor antagonist